jgi:hypothetical protein
LSRTQLLTKTLLTKVGLLLRSSHALPE